MNGCWQEFRLHRGSAPLMRHARFFDLRWAGGRRPSWSWRNCCRLRRRNAARRPDLAIEATIDRYPVAMSRLGSTAVTRSTRSRLEIPYGIDLESGEVTYDASHVLIANPSYPACQRQEPVTDRFDRDVWREMAGDSATRFNIFPGSLHSTR